MIVEGVHRDEDRGVRISRPHGREGQHGREGSCRCDEDVPEIVLFSHKLCAILYPLVCAEKSASKGVVRGRGAGTVVSSSIKCSKLGTHRPQKLSVWERDDPRVRAASCVLYKPGIRRLTSSS